MHKTSSVIYTIMVAMTLQTSSTAQDLFIREWVVQRRVGNASQLTQLVEQCQSYHCSVLRLQLRHLPTQIQTHSDKKSANSSTQLC